MSRIESHPVSSKMNVGSGRVLSMEGSDESMAMPRIASSRELIAGASKKSNTSSVIRSPYPSILSEPPLGSKPAVSSLNEKLIPVQSIKLVLGSWNPYESRSIVVGADVRGWEDVLGRIEGD